jgi:hypothetical protein
MHTKRENKKAEQPIRGCGEENLDQLLLRYQEIKKKVLCPKQDPSKGVLLALKVYRKKHELGTKKGLSHSRGVSFLSRPNREDRYIAAGMSMRQPGILRSRLSQI